MDTKSIKMEALEAKAMCLLEALDDAIHDLPAPDTEALNWAHIGTMGAVVEKLQEVLDFIKG